MYKQEMNTLLELFDKNKTGTIDFKEFSGMLEEVNRMT
jgi:Ca2+-binding EF-hand superfamily protein